MRSTDSNNDRSCVEPNRLLAAADVILAAELKGGTVSMWRDDARPSRDGFSSLELVEALMFLRRLGLMTTRDPKAIRHDPRSPHRT